MEKIPFAENLAQHLPGSYNKNLATLNELQVQAMQEDNRRWRLAEQRYKARQDADDEVKLTKANNMIRTWLDSLQPRAYQDDMRRRVNKLREKFKSTSGQI